MMIAGYYLVYKQSKVENNKMLCDFLWEDMYRHGDFVFYIYFLDIPCE